MTDSHARYHVRLGNKRTTVSLDQNLAELLAVKLGYKPDAPQAHPSIRDWLQAKLDEAADPGRSQVSQWLQSLVIFEIVDQTLYDRHAQWLLDG